MWQLEQQLFEPDECDREHGRLAHDDRGEHADELHGLDSDDLDAKRHDLDPERHDAHAFG